MQGHQGKHRGNQWFKYFQFPRTVHISIHDLGSQCFPFCMCSVHTNGRRFVRTKFGKCPKSIYIFFFLKMEYKFYLSPLIVFYIQLLSQEKYPVSTLGKHQFSLLILSLVCGLFHDPNILAANKQSLWQGFMKI